MNPDDEDDAALFRAALGGVTPLAQPNRVPPPPPRPRYRDAPATPATAVPDTLSDHGHEHAPETYLANGLPRMTLRKLRRDHWPPGDRIDLHGMTIEPARRTLQAFLQRASGRGLRCVLVIHGKGLNSRSAGGVLRSLSRHWLGQHPAVLAYCDAPAHAGGGGATYVLLRAAAPDPVLC